MEASHSLPVYKVPELSIVMPCLNEAETLAMCIAKANAFLSEHGVHGEILVADNGSTDGSLEIAKRFGARVVRAAHRGYGSAVMAGVQAARGKYIIMGDADNSYDFSQLYPFLRKLRGGCDLVMGNRFLGGIEPGAMPLIHRYLGNPLLSSLGRLFYSNPCHDFHCGLRAFQRKSLLRMDLKTTGMEFASEMVLKAALLKMTISEVPTVLAPDGRSRPPHLRTWRDGWRHLRFLLLYSPRWLFLYPGIILSLTSVMVEAWRVSEHLKIEWLSSDVNRLVYVVAGVLVGIQWIALGLVSEFFAVNEGLIPMTKLASKLGNYKLEWAVPIGLILMVIGFSSSVSAVSHLGVIGAISLAVGCQMVGFSFFLSLLHMKRAPVLPEQERNEEKKFQ